MKLLADIWVHPLGERVHGPRMEDQQVQVAVCDVAGKMGSAVYSTFYRLFGTDRSEYLQIYNEFQECSD